MRARRPFPLREAVTSTAGGAFLALLLLLALAASA